MVSELPFRDLLALAIGGGWGKDDPTDGHMLVGVIRGADFPGVGVGDVSGVPMRYEEVRKAEKRLLESDDLLLEVSGGTGDRATGRSLFISEKILKSLGGVVIPASFCRLIRLKKDIVEPRYAYYWLQGMHADERVWGYQVRSTGIANFQFEHFLNTEIVRLPPLVEQRAIAYVLGALDDKIESNRRQHSLIEQTIEASFQNICANFSGEYEVMGNIVEQGVSGVWGSDTQQSESEVCITCLRGVDLHDLASGVIPTAPLRWVSSGQSASRVPQEGEIWVEASGFRCGRSVIIGSHTNALFDQPIRNSNFVKRLVPKISVRHSYLAWLALKKVYTSDEINNFRTGTSIRNLDVEGMLKNVRVPILDDARASQLEGLLQCLVSPSRAKETLILENLRAALLPELLSGRLRIKDAESMVENV